MAEPLFISQRILETWLDEGKVVLAEGVLTLREPAGSRLQPALRVLSVLGGEDRAGLVGQVRAVAQLVASGAEHYRDSLIIGDTAYQCEEGYTAAEEAAGADQHSQPKVAAAPSPPTPASPSSAKPAPAAPSAAVAPLPPPPPAKGAAASAPASPPKKEGEAEVDLLADFMLKHM